MASGAKKGITNARSEQSKTIVNCKQLPCKVQVDVILCAEHRYYHEFDTTLNYMFSESAMEKDICAGTN